MHGVKRVGTTMNNQKEERKKKKGGVGGTGKMNAL